MGLDHQIVTAYYFIVVLLLSTTKRYKTGIIVKWA